MYDDILVRNTPENSSPTLPSEDPPAEGPRRRYGKPLSFERIAYLAGKKVQVIIQDGKPEDTVFMQKFRGVPVYITRIVDDTRLTGREVQAARIYVNKYFEGTVNDSDWGYHTVPFYLYESETENKTGEVMGDKKGTFSTAFSEMRDMNMDAAKTAGRVALTCALTDEVLMRAFNKAFGSMVPSKAHAWFQDNFWGRWTSLYVLRPITPLVLLNGIMLASKVFGKTLPHSDIVSLYTRDALDGKWRDALQPVFSRTAQMFMEIAGELRGRALPQSTDAPVKCDE